MWLDQVFYKIEEPRFFGISNAITVPIGQYIETT